MMGEHKHRNVVRRIFSPPAIPSFVRPGTANRPEHIPPDNPSPHIGETASHEIVIYSGGSAFPLMHLIKSSRGEGPFVHCLAADAERVCEVLVGACAVAINGDGKVSHLESGHEKPLDEFARPFAPSVKRMGQPLSETGPG